MIKSMTAYAAVSHEENQIHVDVEIRSYNSKNLDVALYLPKSCHPFEEEIKKCVASCVARGRVEVRIFMENSSENGVTFQVNESRAAAYHAALAALKERFSLSSEITLDHILGGHDMIVATREETAADEIWAVISTAVTRALADLDAMRSCEGANLITDLENRLDTMEKGLVTVSEGAAAIPEIYRQKLMERIAVLTKGVDAVDPVRLSQEAAFLADKSDISEELVRAASHIKQFRETLGMNEPVGRKLNFLIQEFLREFNTMGSKTGKAEISHVIVELKSELEKVREQVQNIE